MTASESADAFAPADAAGRPHSPSTAALVAFDAPSPPVQSVRVYLDGAGVVVIDPELKAVDDESRVLGFLDANAFDPQDLGTLKSVATEVAKHENAKFSQKVAFFLRHFLTSVVEDFGVSQSEVGKACVLAFEHADGVKPVNQSVVSGIMSDKLTKQNAAS